MSDELSETERNLAMLVVRLHSLDLILFQRYLLKCVFEMTIRSSIRLIKDHAYFYMTFVTRSRLKSI